MTMKLKPPTPAFLFVFLWLLIASLLVLPLLLSGHSFAYEALGEESVKLTDKAAPPQEAPEALIRRLAREYGLDEDEMVKVAFCESSLNPSAIGDFGESVGLWQWRLKDHPEITRECALNAACSTQEAMKAIKSGKLWWWSCAK